MTESTTPTPLQSQAEKIKTDLSAMLLKAAQATAKAPTAPATSTGAASSAATEQKSSPTAQ